MTSTNINITISNKNILSLSDADCKKIKKIIKDNINQNKTIQDGLDDLMVQYNFKSTIISHIKNDLIIELNKIPQNNSIENKNTIYYNSDDENDKDEAEYNSEFVKMREINVISTEIDQQIYRKPTFNIGVFGCFNTGKSTFINSLFANNYAEMRVGKGTMCPQIYETDNKCIYTEEIIKNIQSSIKSINDDLRKSDNKTNIIMEVTNLVPAIDIFDSYNDNINFKIYDIPGLNDSDTSEKYYNYINTNFYKFDLVIFNLDIQQALGSVEENKIIDSIQKSISMIKQEYNRDIKMLIVCNKIDTMETNELEKQFEQVKQIITSKNIICPIVKYSSKYSHLYRSIPNAITPIDDDKLMNEIGEKCLGMLWHGKYYNQNRTSKMKILQDCINENKQYLYETCGFNSINSEINGILKSTLTTMFYSKLNYCTNKRMFKTKYELISQMNTIFNSTNDKISIYLEEYFEYLNDRYSITKIEDDKTHKRIIRLKERFHKLSELNLANTNIIKINQNIETIDNMIADYEINKLTEKNLLSGEIFLLLEQIQRTTHGMNKLKLNINCLEKVPIEDYEKMITILYGYGIGTNDLLRLFTNSFITFCNKTNYGHMIKNYIHNLYLKTDENYLNYLSCRIEPNIIHEELYDETKFNVLLDYLKPLIVFFTQYYVTGGKISISC